MSVSIREAVQISSHSYGRDALLRDPALHVHKREQMPYPLDTRERPWEKPKTSFARATPDRAGARPYLGADPSALPLC